MGKAEQYSLTACPFENPEEPELHNLLVDQSCNMTSIPDPFLPFVHLDWKNRRLHPTALRRTAPLTCLWKQSRWHEEESISQTPHVTRHRSKRWNGQVEPWAVSIIPTHPEISGAPEVINSGVHGMEGMYKRDSNLLHIAVPPFRSIIQVTNTNQVHPAVKTHIWS